MTSSGEPHSRRASAISAAADVVAGVDPADQFALGLVLGRLAPVVDQAAHVVGEHLLAHPGGVGVDPGVAAQDPAVVAARAAPQAARYVARHSSERSSDCVGPHSQASPRRAARRSPHPPRRRPTAGVRLLDRPRVDGEGVETVEAALEADVGLASTTGAGSRAPPPSAPPLGERRAEHLVLERPPAEADAERDPPARHLVDGGDLLGDAHRVVEGELEDAGAHPQRVGPGRHRGEERQRVAHVAGHEVVVADRRGVEPGRLPSRANSNVRAYGSRACRSRKIGNEKEKRIGGCYCGRADEIVREGWRPGGDERT